MDNRYILSKFVRNQKPINMNKKFLVLGALGLMLASCGGPGKAEYDAAAQKMCDCMAEKSAENAAEESGLDIDMTDLDYSLCALDAVMDVNIKDDQMTASIEEKCPDLKETHVEYIKGL